MSPDIPWQVLRVASNQEKSVVRSLAARSIEHYLPLFTERRRWADRTVVAESPLFPGYVFIRYLPQQRISVISTPGVVRVLGEEKRDLVDAGEVERIRHALTGGLLLRPHPFIIVGERVRVLRGPFTGKEGIVREFRHQCVVVLSLAGMSQNFSLQAESCDLELLSKPVGVVL